MRTELPAASAGTAAGQSMSLRPKARLATADVPMTANSATTTADGMVVTPGGFAKVMSPPKMPSNSTASHIVTILMAAGQDHADRLHQKPEGRKTREPVTNAHDHGRAR